MLQEIRDVSECMNKIREEKEKKEAIIDWLDRNHVSIREWKELQIILGIKIEEK